MDPRPHPYLHPHYHPVIPIQSSPSSHPYALNLSSCLTSSHPLTLSPPRGGLHGADGAGAGDGDGRLQPQLQELHQVTPPPSASLPSLPSLPLTRLCVHLPCAPPLLPPKPSPPQVPPVCQDILHQGQPQLPHKVRTPHQIPSYFMFTSSPVPPRHVHMGEAKHSRVKSIPCPHCQKMFSRKGHMTEHVRTVHEGKKRIYKEVT